MKIKFSLVLIIGFMCTTSSYLNGSAHTVVADSCTASTSKKMAYIPFKATVVFDIDETICRKSDKEGELKYPLREYFPNCKVVEYTDESTGDVYPHYFNPYIDYLFDYLLQSQVRIVFFSSGVAARNIQLIQTYFSEMLGADTYNELHQNGQFTVFSREHMVKGTYGNKAKDLEAIGLSLEESILVEDDASFRAKGQESLLKINYYAYYRLYGAINSLRKDSSLSWELYFSLNQGLYLLGVISTALDGVNDKVSFRSILTNIFKPLQDLPNDIFQPTDISIFQEKGKFAHQFVEDMIAKGLLILREKNPAATLIKDFPFTIDPVWGRS